MLTDVEGPELLVDTSVAVPLLVTDHQTRDRRALEVYRVLKVDAQLL